MSSRVLQLWSPDLCLCPVCPTGKGPSNVPCLAFLLMSVFLSFLSLLHLHLHLSHRVSLLSSICLFVHSHLCPSTLTLLVDSSSPASELSRPLSSPKGPVSLAVVCWYRTQSLSFSDTCWSREVLQQPQLLQKINSNCTMNFLIIRKLNSARNTGKKATARVCLIFLKYHFANLLPDKLNVKESFLKLPFYLYLTSPVFLPHS